MSLLIESIRSGNSHAMHVPRSMRRKLWDWCRKRSELDGSAVNVRRIQNEFIKGRLEYVADYVQRKRMGRAYPVIYVRPRYDTSRCMNVIDFSSIVWEYVR